MYYEKHQNAAGSKITVTATATNIYDLINTAASTNLPRAGFAVDTNGIDITVEDGDIRLLWDGNTPTSVNGILLSSGNVYYFRGLPLDNMKLIRVSADVVCSVAPGKSDRAESTNASAFSASGGGSSSTTTNSTISGGTGAYSNTKGDFTATANSGGKTVTISGLPFTLTAGSVAVGSALQKSSAGVNTAIPLTTVTVSGSVITFTDMAADFAVGDTVELSLVAQDKAHEVASNATRVGRIDPDWTKNLGYTIVEVTNGTDGTYNYYVDMDGYRKAGFQFELSGGSGTVTVKLYGTLQDDGTVDSSCTYQDITNDVFGVASITADDIWVDDAGKLGLFKYLKIEVVASTGGSNDADWTVFAKKLF